MIKVLAAALAGTVAGIIVMVVVIALSGTDTPNASTEDLEFPTATQPPGETVGGTNPSDGGETGGGTGGETGGGGGEDGAQVFTDAGCGSCHAFEPAGATGAVGPGLDGTSLDVAAIEEQVRNGGGGMPPFEGQLTDEQITAVSEYVASGG